MTRIPLLFACVLVTAVALPAAAADGCSNPGPGLVACDPDGDGRPEDVAAGASLGGEPGADAGARCMGLDAGATPFCSDLLVAAGARTPGPDATVGGRCGSVSVLGEPCPLDLRAGATLAAAGGEAGATLRVRPDHVALCEEDPVTGFACLP